MDRIGYQKLRFDVQQEIANGFTSEIFDSEVLTNSVMRLFLHAISEDQVKSRRIASQFKTFRRNPDLKAPSWAYRDPGTSSRTPTV